jgi:hypothetical protein
MLARLSRTILLCLPILLSQLVYAQEKKSEPDWISQPQGKQTVPVPPELAEATREPWIDRVHYTLYWTLWRSAMGIDRLFGGESDAAEYQDVAGSLAPALLWDEFEGWQPKLRFRAKLPLPHADRRFDAFVGRVNRDEYVTERERESGAIASQRGAPVEDDQTLVGIRFSPKHRDRFQATGGVRVATPLDPYVKGSYRYQRGKLDSALITLRETAFWQNSEDFGFTSRADIERILDEKWLARYTISATISEQSEGVRGYTGLTFLRELPRRRAVAAELFASGEFDADVPLREYGLKVAYRKSVIRDWLVLEVRTSISWPREELDFPRTASWGVGVGLEVFFGTEEFQSRPVTF